MQPLEIIPHTCPAIDELISAVKSVNWHDTYWEQEYLIAQLEKLRTANSKLRFANGKLGALMDFYKQQYEKNTINKG